MNRIKGFALRLGVAMLIVAGLACGAEEQQDPTKAGAASDVPQAHHRPAPSAPAGDNTPNPTPRPPPPPAPTAPPHPPPPFHPATALDVNYVHSGSAERPSGEGTVFVIDGIEINLDVLEMVGTTYEGNAAGRHDGLVVYRLKVGGTNDVYTCRPGEDHLNPEDGQIFKGRDVWIRWTAR